MDQIDILEKGPRRDLSNEDDIERMVDYDQLEEERDENGETINRGGFFMADIHDWPLPPNFQSDR